ncbi:hypothetical protein CISIN_1g044606mg, partial [Citrus sinensis]
FPILSHRKEKPPELTTFKLLFIIYVYVFFKKRKSLFVMEKHKCRLCFKNFSNGRALGGHMRSHMLNLPIPQKIQEEEEEREHRPHHQQLSFEIETESASSPSSSTSPSEEDDEEKSLFYGLRENPKRSIRLVDPEFSFGVVDASAAAAAAASASVVLQDRESETESSKNPTRRRSKRTRKLEQQHRQELDIIKKLKLNKSKNTIESSLWGHEPEPVSSISDTTTEEDQQQHHHDLIMFRQQDDDEYEDEEAEKSMDETDESEEFKSFNNKNRSRGKYKCETCKKVFKSYQALGGHRASHKKIKFYTPVQETELDQENAGASINLASPPLSVKKVHECPVCFRVFSSGQALGGHKRTHVTGLVASTSARSASASTKLGENLIDLNLPAPIDDDDISQIELSAVSDAEFVNHIKR